MPLPTDPNTPDDNYQGPARLFPLPDLVVFPHVVQPLHVFEPRYRALLDDAMRDDRLIAMALLQPGWESEYEGRPPIDSLVCVGQVIARSELDDGRSNLLLLGRRRAHVVAELPPNRPFRQAEVELLADCYPTEAASQRPTLQRRLTEQFRELLQGSRQMEEQLDQLLSGQVPLGTLTDVVGHTLDLSHAVKRQLFAELDVDRRAEKLLEELAQLAEDPSRALRHGFPMQFSDN